MSEHIVTMVGEDRDVRQFFGFFVGRGGEMFPLKQVGANLGWQVDFTRVFLSGLASQGLVSVHRGVVNLTARGQRALKELYTRREL